MNFEKKMKPWLFAALLSLLVCIVLISCCFSSCANSTNPTTNDTTPPIAVSPNTPGDTVTIPTPPDTTSSIPESIAPTCKHEDTIRILHIDATCTLDGYSGDIQCAKCFEILSSGVFIPATGHIETVLNNVPPTCVQIGYSGDVVCVTCHEVLKKGELIEALGHSPALMNQTPATCTKDGYSGDEVCNICGEITVPGNAIPALGHNITMIRVEAPTCTQSGYTGDEYCTRCETEVEYGNFIPATGHNTTVVNAKATTCTEKGYTGDYVCTVCHEVLEPGVGIAPTGHSTTLINACLPTCTVNGYSGDEVCHVCGENTAPGKVIPALGHNITIVRKQEATCTSSGYTGDEYCVRCEQDIEYGHYIAAKGHKYGDWVVSKEATGFETGSKYRVCATCKHKETASIPKTELYPIVEEGDGYKITITREWYKKAWVYVAHLEFTDYKRFGTDCANGKYNNGYETTSHAAKRLGAILAINGCYSAPYLDYTVVRNGKIWNGAERNMCIPGVYSSYTGLFQSAWEGKQGTSGIYGVNVQQLVDKGKVTDTFCFGPPGLINGELSGKNEGARAQRTFMGTNGKAGDIWLCVSDGRYNDNESAGLTFYEGMEFLTTKGCTFGLHLDGGGSSTMVYRGHVLNAAKGNERAVVDFVYFR